jgi:hypothetical protein
MSDSEIADFRKFINSTLLSETGIYKYFVDRTAPSDNPSRNVVKMSLEGECEVGAAGGKLHFHGIVKIEHKGLFSFEANKFRNDARRELGYTIYLAAPVSSDPIAAYAQYLRKGNKIAE